VNDNLVCGPDSAPTITVTLSTGRDVCIHVFQ
jgi:hypothetical protein